MNQINLNEASERLVSNTERAIREGREQASLLATLARHHGETIGRNGWHSGAERSRALYGIVPSFFNAGLFGQWLEYQQDFAQRAILLQDTLRQRGETYIQREKEGFKPVLIFDYEMVMDGRRMERPVNYALVRIHPPQGFPEQREDGRPWVIIDPRAGHGSGIGGFKSDSEVGVALRDGHPVYFVIFFPDPEPGQTLADVCNAEAEFLREVHRRHPDSPKPLLTGNCQGGWASMILAATHPELMGPVVIAGAPLSYWAGEKGKNPFRYLGGISGGVVPALLMSDLGGGKFDGAHLVFNFEHLNPANTWWRKNYDIFSRIDTEAGRFLEFENWWSGFYFMNENEIRWIVENLFVGNRLTRGQAILNDGTPIDLTRIASPVVVFASHGDNITPPQQALNWIPDLYGSVSELRARGHVIIYTLHDSIGHLGIFVSANVASKQHKQIASVVKTIEALAPGLYEMIIEENDGAFTVDFQARTIDDILALDDGREEEEEFAAVSQVSEWATRTYEMTVRPIVKAMVTPGSAEFLKRSHPMRVQRYMFTRDNPLMKDIDGLADRVREKRIPAAPDNPFLKLERFAADAIEANWNLYRDMRDAMTEMMFHGIYATPWMRALAREGNKPAEHRDASQLPQVRTALAKAKQGGYAEAIVRMLILLAAARGSVRRERLERSDKLLHSRPPFDTMPQEHRTQLIHEQSMIVEFAPQEALSTLPDLLHDDVDRIRAVNFVMDVAGPVDEMNAPTIAMFKKIQAVLLTVPHDWNEPKHEISAHEPGQHPSVATPNKAKGASRSKRRGKQGVANGQGK